MKIILVRHGETEYNRKSLVQGRSNIPLNDQGKLDAINTASALKKNNIKFDLIYSSPSDRAFETANIIIKELNLDYEIIKDEHFFERNFGPYEAKKVKDVFPIKIETGDYENDDAIIKRVNEGIKNLYLKHPKQTILIACHSHTIKSILIKMDPNIFNFRTFIKNGAIFILKYNGDNYKIINRYNNQ